MYYKNPFIHTLKIKEFLVKSAWLLKNTVNQIDLNWTPVTEW